MQKNAYNNQKINQSKNESRKRKFRGRAGLGTLPVHWKWMENVNKVI